MTALASHMDLAISSAPPSASLHTEELSLDSIPTGLAQLCDIDGRLHDTLQQGSRLYQMPCM